MVPKVNNRRDLYWGDAIALIDMITKYSAAVRQQSRECRTSTCPHCGFAAADDRRFKLHARRDRIFFVIIGAYVRALQVCLPRWRCPACHKTFTEYPNFALPYRRYLSPQIRQCAWNYMTQADVDYRKVVCQSNLPIFHGDDFGSAPDAATEESDNTRALAHTSPFRWITCLACETDDTPRNLTSDFELSRIKYRSAFRRSLLLACFARLSRSV